MSLRIVIDPGIVQDYPGLAISLGVPSFITASPRNELGQVNPRPFGHAWPVAGYFVVQDCGGTLAFFDGPLTGAQIAAIAPCTADANAATLRDRAQTALVNNGRFLAVTSPTTAQSVAQVRALTRQVDGIMRLLLPALDSLEDS